MKNNLKDILSHTHKELEDQQLMDYLSGKMQQHEIHDMEAQMLEDPFLEDAMEGLSTISSTKEVNTNVAALRKNLHQQLQKKKEKKKRRNNLSSYWTYIAILVVLVTIVVSYFVLKLF